MIRLTLDNTYQPSLQTQSSGWKPCSQADITNIAAQMSHPTDDEISVSGGTFNLVVEKSLPEDIQGNNIIIKEGSKYRTNTIERV